MQAMIKNIIRVIKAYKTRVGGGPLQPNSMGILATSSKTRRAAEEDVAGSALWPRYSAAVNHYTSLKLIKLDVLDMFSTIRVAVAYVTPGGEKLTSSPAALNLLSQCTIEHVDFTGWQSSTKELRRWSNLPSKAQKFLEFTEPSVGVKIAYIGTGPDREDMILRGSIEFRDTFW
jgi:adenylosuccinate synthase